MWECMNRLLKFIFYVGFFFFFRANFKTFGDPDEGAPTRFQNVFQPLVEPGLQTDRMTRAGALGFNTPLSFFSLFFTQAIIIDICNFTNKYAWTHILEKPTYANSSGAWQETNVEEMTKLIGLIIFMGGNTCHSIKEFWSTYSLFAPPQVIRKMISRDRFQALMCFLRVVDQDAEDPADRLCKVRTFLEHIKHVCQTVYKPYEHISVDERMVRSKHHSGMRQYIKSKPVKFGFKFWVLADSLNGYTYDFDVYGGRRETASDMGLGYDVVMRLCNSLRDQGYFVFFDNFYSSPRLVRDLWAKGFKACGTIMCRRIGVPPELSKKLRVPGQRKKYKNDGTLKPAKTAKWGDIAERGASRWLRKDGLLFLQWKDRKVVTMISNCHKGTGSILADRQVKDKVTKQWHKIRVHKPEVIDSYNQYMSGVDRSDQLINKYNVLMRCLRWWKVIFFHCIDIAVVNSYILFQKWREQHPNRPELHRNANYGQIQFREELIREIMGLPAPPNVCDPPQPVPAVAPQAIHTHLPELSEKHKNCTLCYLQEQAERKTFVHCSDCWKTHLCLNKSRNCFRDWHTQTFLQARTERNSKK